METATTWEGEWCAGAGFGTRALELGHPDWEDDEAAADDEFEEYDAQGVISLQAELIRDQVSSLFDLEGYED